ncbi:MAG: zf-HC2 domain-containing protein, partial [bacterium]|nr:zf-HC2 domain-containing protein [bacterium]
MTHTEIDRHDVVERYVAGKLSADDEARFEEHYLDCPACTQAIEDAERLHRGLAMVAAQDLVVRRSIFTAAVLRTGRGAMLAAALLVVLLLPAGLAWQRAGRLDAELAAARRELADERRPRINTPILTLGPSRVGEPPTQQIS